MRSRTPFRAWLCTVWTAFLLPACGLAVEGQACLGCGGFEAGVAPPDAGGAPLASVPVALRPPAPDADAGGVPDAEPSAPGAAYAAAVRADAPVAFWPLAADGADALGRFPAAAAGPAAGVRFGADGPFGPGTAAAFAGGCLDAGAVPGLGGALTVALWVAWDAPDRALVRRAGTAFAAPGAFAGWGLRLSNDDPARPTWESGPAGAAAGFTAAPVARGAWAHLAVVGDGANAVVYVDGAPAGTGAAAAAATADTLTIGCDPRGAFRGRLAGVAVYDHALTAARVAAHARAVR